MDASLTEIVAAVTAVGGMCGLSIKYLVDRISVRQSTLEKRQDEERTRFESERIKHELKAERLRWEAVMADQVTEMRKEIATQERQIGYLRRVSDAYLRHIAALEGLMREAGIQIPSLVLPDYPMIDDDRDEEGDCRRRRGHGRDREIEAC